MAGNGNDLGKVPTKQRRTTTTGRRRFTDLTIYNVGAKTSPMDIVLLLRQKGFRPIFARIEMLNPQFTDVAEGIVTVLKREGRRAEECLNSQRWRGKQLCCIAEEWVGTYFSPPEGETDSKLTDGKGTSIEKQNKDMLARPEGRKRLVQ